MNVAQIEQTGNTVNYQTKPAFCTSQQLVC